jgi:hypothetical protein
MRTDVYVRRLHYGLVLHKVAVICLLRPTIVACSQAGGDSLHQNIDVLGGQASQCRTIAPNEI